MKKCILLTSIATLFVLQVLAQDEPSASTTSPSGRKFSVGLDFGLPMGDEGDVYSISFGGSGKMEVPFSDAFYGTVTAGFTSLYLKEEFNDLFDPQGFIPVKAGGKYYFGNMNYYVEGEVGAVFGIEDGAGTAFAYAPGLGISFPVSDKGAIDAGARYEGWSNDGTFSQIGFRIAYKFQ